MKPIALFSLYDTSRAAEFGRALVELGWNIMASQETVAVLKSEAIPCSEIADFTGVGYQYGFPPTLHPRVEHALTAAESPERIELVYVISYPPAIGNDVGGRTLLALAAKGNRLPVISAADMERVISSLQAQGSVSDNLRCELIDKVNAEIAEHFLKLAVSHSSWEQAGTVGWLHYDLANGENPYQKAVFYRTQTDDPLALANFINLSETPPCFTNLADVDNVLNTICLAGAAFQEQFGKMPYLCVGAKHGNPCGMAYGWDDPSDVIERALFGNPLAVWGGELITNFTIDNVLAELLVRHPRREALLGTAAWMLDVVIAPDFDPAAAERLLQRKSRKVLRNPYLYHPFITTDPYSYRWVRGGFFRQSPPWRVLKLAEAEKTDTEIKTEDIESLILAWAVAFTSFHGGNEVALVKDGSLVGVGGGPSTVQAAQVAVERAGQAGYDLRSSVFCADAFFPFTDAPQILIDAGTRLGCVPAGGKNEPEVRKLFAESGVQMVYLPEDFRGFCKH